MSAPQRPRRHAAAGPAALRFLEHQPPRHRRRVAATAGGQLLYLLATGATVVPVRRLKQAWECVVITTGDAPVSVADPPPLVLVTDIEIETALPVQLVHPLGGLAPAVADLVWLTRVWQRVPGGPLTQLAAAVLEVRDAQTGLIHLTDEVTHRLVTRSGHRPPAIRVGLDRLAQSGLLTPANQSNDEVGCPAYTLRITPGLPVVAGRERRPEAMAR